MNQRHRFVVDQMLGRLSKWLRLLGYDSLYFNSIANSQLIKIAREENRILLTRDTRLMKRRVVRNKEIKAIFIEHDGLDDQLKQLSQELNLKEGLMPWCVECNLPIEMIRKEEAYQRVPEYVYQTQDEFARCPACGRYYWPGTHWQRIQEKFAKLSISTG